MARATVDVDELAERLLPALAATFPGAGRPTLTQMPTGMSSLTYAVDVPPGDARAPARGAPRRIAVKVAPPGLAPVRNRDVLRQARVLRALDGSPGVVVPSVLFEDEGAPPEVPPLFAMTFLEGDCFEPLSDEGDPPPPSVVGARALGAARMLAALHAVDPGAGALSGEPVVTLEAEVGRWTRLFGAVGDELRPAAAGPIGERLLAGVPAPARPALIHGDYRLGNIIYAGTEPRAIIDWEIWSVEDPRVDLAWFLLNSDPRKPNAFRTGTGMPPVADLVGAYAGARGEAVADLDWFHALVRFKQAAASAFIVKNNRKRPRPDPRQERVAAYIGPLLDAADEHLRRTADGA